MDAPAYKKIVACLRERIEKQMGEPFVAISRIDVACMASDREVEEVWPRLMAELWLVDDGTGTRTFTVPGHGISVETYAADIEERRARRDFRLAAVDTPRTSGGDITADDIKRRWKAWQNAAPGERRAISLKTYVRQELATTTPHTPLANAFEAFLRR